MRLTPLLTTAVLLFALGIPGGGAVGEPAPRAAALPVEGKLPSFSPPREWLNSPPLTPAGLEGKVVLVGIWPYSCINWLRTLPYLRAWSEKYGKHGLVVIGVHTPEFAFERNLDNVRAAVKAYRIDYPVVVDSDWAIWRALDNQYWPAAYLVDARGRIRYHQFGEGEYEATERAIQALLLEAGHKDVPTGLVSVHPSGAEVAADWDRLESPETYLGAKGAESFASPGGARPGQRHVYQLPASLSRNAWALAGDWTLGPEATALNAAGGRVAYRFHARDVHLVVGPGARGAPVRIRVRIDGKPPGADHGTDIDDAGLGTVTQPRLHQLIRQRGPIVDRQLEIEFLDPGAELFSFTFG